MISQVFKPSKGVNGQTGKFLLLPKQLEMIDVTQTVISNPCVCGLALFRLPGVIFTLTVLTDVKALWGAFVDCLIDNDAKVASSKKHTKFKTRVQNTYPIYYQNGQARYANLLPKFGTAHTYMTR